MAVKRVSAETLIELAIATLKSELQPALPAEHRYTAAMLANALEIARREIVTDGQSERWNLLDSIYPEAEGEMKQLAADIRSGKVNSKKHPELAERLKALVIEELKISNPRFLKTRAEAGKL